MSSPRFPHAFEHAATLHAADLRKGSKAPCLSHLLEVCAIVLRYGRGEDAAVAAFRHDGPEDHGGKPRLVEIQSNFGKIVAGILKECTDSTKTPRDAWDGGEKGL